MPVPSLVLRLEKGTPLTPGEWDNNLKILREFADGLESRVNVTLDVNGVIKLLGIVNGMIADTTITGAKLANQTITAEKILNTLAGDGLLKAANADNFSLSLDGVTLELDGSTPKKLRVKDGGITTDKLAPGVAFGSQVLLAHEVSSGNASGALTTGGWRTRPLNAEKRNVNGVMLALASNQFRLATGVYRAWGWSRSESTQLNQCRLYNVSATTTAILGSGGYSPGTEESPAILGPGYFTVTDTTHLYELQHRSASTGTFGLPVSFGENELYAVLELVKES